MVAETPRHLGVVGAGTMGAQIAYQAALHGYQVTLCGRDAVRLEESAQGAAAILRRRMEKGKLSVAECDTALAGVTRSCDRDALAGCDIVIESVAEDRVKKREVLADISTRVGKDTLIGTNSSTLPSSMFADVVTHPERLCNVHFFNPALTMPLVEVVQGEHTADSVVERAMTFARDIGKRPVRLRRESYGFLANRMLFIALREAFTLVENGFVSMEDCDDAVRSALAWPLGPFALADLIGLDVTAAILREGALQTGEARWAPPRILTERVERGEVGRKTSRGFYASN